MRRFSNKCNSTEWTLSAMFSRFANARVKSALYPNPKQISSIFMGFWCVESGESSVDSRVNFVDSVICFAGDSAESSVDSADSAILFAWDSSESGVDSVDSAILFA